MLLINVKNLGFDYIDMETAKLLQVTAAARQCKAMKNLMLPSVFCYDFDPNIN
jgi:hypothetical protein